MYTEFIGVVASLFVLLAMMVKSTTTQGNLIMRIVNLIGSLVFVVYGTLIPAYSTAIMNVVAAVINIVYIVRLSEEFKTQKMDS